MDEITIWGTGRPKREFLHIDDMADASLFVHNLDPAVYYKHTTPMLSQINIGSGIENTIENYAKFIMNKLNLKLNIQKDLSKPNGTPRKILSTKLAKKYGWKSKINLDVGFNLTYKDFLKKNK